MLPVAFAVFQTKASAAKMSLARLQDTNSISAETDRSCPRFSRKQIRVRSRNIYGLRRLGVVQKKDPLLAVRSPNRNLDARRHVQQWLDACQRRETPQHSSKARRIEIGSDVDRLALAEAVHRNGHSTGVGPRRVAAEHLSCCGL